MRHRVAISKLGKRPAHRRAMLRNMVTSLLRHERIRTTAPKAKEARRHAEHMITLGKRGDLHARRLAARFINDETVLKKLFDEIAGRFQERRGGYTRILRTGPRLGDRSDMAILELVTQSPARQKPKNRKTRERLAEFKAGEEGGKPKRKGGRKSKPAEGGADEGREDGAAEAEGEAASPAT
jgi:large subunit ribosomal protein L17